MFMKSVVTLWLGAAGLRWGSLHKHTARTDLTDRGLTWAALLGWMVHHGYPNGIQGAGNGLAGHSAATESLVNL